MKIKAKRQEPAGERPYVDVKDARVRIRIGAETRSYEPSALTHEEAARWLASADLSRGTETAPLSVDGCIYGVNVRQWLHDAVERARGLRALALVRAARVKLVGRVSL